ncbi:MAG TPA: macro domain-containing protein [Verrucomicrobiales bacterium]|nr:macro domain-containing protein [Verrucomicrobiales bacterium]
MLPNLTLSREPLQTLKVDAIAYGAKDTGEMGGGAAAAILAAAGPDILTELRSSMTGSSRRVGDVAITGSFRLQSLGVRWVVHVISIIKHTPSGAHCPEPERLRDGTATALKSATALGVRSIAFSALGTGEGRVTPRDAAGYMIEGIKAFRLSHPDANPAITLALPNFADFEAFLSAIHNSR